MGKRAPPRTSAKAARQEQPPSKLAKPAADPFLDTLQPVLKIVEQADSLPQSCRDMLASMVPYTLRTPKEERHRYQAAVAEVLDGVLKNLEAERQQAVEEAQRSLDEAVAAQRPAEEQLARATEAAEPGRLLRDHKDDARKASIAATAAAREALATERQREEALTRERTEAQAAKQEYEQLLQDQFAAVKEGSIPGRLWRVRDAKIGEVAQALAIAGAESSVLSALPVALRLKPQDRGSFAQRVVDHAEALIKRHIGKLDECLATADERAAEQRKAVEAAEANVKAAESTQERATQELIDAENSLLELETAKQEAAKHVKELSSRAAGASEVLKAAESELADFQAMVAKFQQLQDGPKLAPELAEEPAPEPSEEAIGDGVM